MREGEAKLEKHNRPGGDQKKEIIHVKRGKGIKDRGAQSTAKSKAKDMNSSPRIILLSHNIS
jgi:hypothetical protein